MNRLVRIALCLAVFCVSAAAQVTLNAAGATFPYPIYSKWFSEYNKVNPKVQINYQSIGSGGGIQQLKAGTVDFGASDMPLNDAMLQEIKVPIVQLPTVLGSVVPAYNVPGVNQELKFTPAMLAGIFLGKITNWNSPEIAKANPGVKFPNQEIVVVHRSDGSGTTFVFTDYLCKVSPEWAGAVGKNTSVKWPLGVGGKGNEGVAGTIRQIAGSIGYVELIYAVQNKIPYGSVQNAAGVFVKASLESTTAAASSAQVPANFVVSITNAPGKDAYPISSFTYLLIPTQWKDAGKSKIMTDFLNWMLVNGQSMTQQLDYAPLPKSLVAKEQAATKQIH